MRSYIFVSPTPMSRAFKTEPGTCKRYQLF
jgi:hypothetical protein